VTVAVELGIVIAVVRMPSIVLVLVTSLELRPGSVVTRIREFLVIISWSVCARVGTLWMVMDYHDRQRYVGALKRVSGRSYWGGFEYVVVFR
jgi:hypothetical protein